jgi:hypothetical protein
MTAREPQMLRDEYSRDTKFLKAEYMHTFASLDDEIKSCENFHVEEQHQLKKLIHKYEHVLDVALAELNMETTAIRLQLMDTNCKPVHALAYTVPRSVKQYLQQSKEIVRLVNIGVLKEDYYSEWVFSSHHLRFLRKTKQ